MERGFFYTRIFIRSSNIQAANNLPYRYNLRILMILIQCSTFITG